MNKENVFDRIEFYLQKSREQYNDPEMPISRVLENIRLLELELYTDGDLDE